MKKRRRVGFVDLTIFESKGAVRLIPNKMIAILSGYHQKVGDDVILILENINFKLFDMVYFVYPMPDLYCDLEWLNLPNAYFLGEYSPIEQSKIPDIVWTYNPSFKIYRSVEKYYHFNKISHRLMHSTPVIFKRLKFDSSYDFSKRDIFILDDFNELTEEDLEELMFLNARTIATSIQYTITDFDFLKKIFYMLDEKRIKIVNTKYFCDLSFIMKSEKNYNDFIDLFINNKIGTKNIYNLLIYFGNLEWTDEEWWEALNFVLALYKKILMETNHKIIFVSRYSNNFRYKDFLKNLRSWCTRKHKSIGYSYVDYSVLHSRVKFSLDEVIAYLQCGDKMRSGKPRGAAIQSLEAILKREPERLKGLLTVFLTKEEYNEIKGRQKKN